MEMCIDIIKNTIQLMSRDTSSIRLYDTPTHSMVPDQMNCNRVAQHVAKKVAPRAFLRTFMVKHPQKTFELNITKVPILFQSNIVSTHESRLCGFL